MVLSNAAAGFIGASVTLVLVIIFMILMVILVRQCLAFIAKRNAIRHQLEQRQQVREQIRQRRGSVSEPIPATFDWHHAIRIEGTPPPSYIEAKELPALDNEEGENEEQTTNKGSKEKNFEDSDSSSLPTQTNKIQMNSSDSSTHEITVIQSESINGAAGGSRSAAEETRTFTTGYTDFDSAQRST